MSEIIEVGLLSIVKELTVPVKFINYHKLTVESNDPNWKYGFPTMTEEEARDYEGKYYVILEAADASLVETYLEAAGTKALRVESYDFYGKTFYHALLDTESQRLMDTLDYVQKYRELMELHLKLTEL